MQRSVRALLELLSPTEGDVSSGVGPNDPRMAASWEALDALVEGGLPPDVQHPFASRWTLLQAAAAWGLTCQVRGCCCCQLRVRRLASAVEAVRAANATNARAAGEEASAPWRQHHPQGWGWADGPAPGSHPGQQKVRQGAGCSGTPRSSGARPGRVDTLPPRNSLQPPRRAGCAVACALLPRAAAGHDMPSQLLATMHVQQFGQHTAAHGREPWSGRSSASAGDRRPHRPERPECIRVQPSAPGGHTRATPRRG